MVVVFLLDVFLGKKRSKVDLPLFSTFVNRIVFLDYLLEKFK